MNKIFENANEQHVRSVKLYFNDSDSILYLDFRKENSNRKRRSSKIIYYRRYIYS